MKRKNSGGEGEEGEENINLCVKEGGGEEEEKRER